MRKKCRNANIVKVQYKPISRGNFDKCIFTDVSLGGRRHLVLDTESERSITGVVTIRSHSPQFHIWS